MNSASTSASRAARPAAGWRRALAALVWVHRWTGVGLCLLFAAWFASGAVMLFVPFPSLPMGQRAERAETVDLRRVLLSPAQALARAGGGASLRLVSRRGEPVFVAEQGKGPPVVVSAQSGAVLGPIAPQSASRIAAAFAGVRAKAVSGPFDYDQWVVHPGFDRGRPYYRVRMEGGQGSDLYVSSRTGEVVQRTDRRQRLWNTAGAVIHWIYVTPLRRSQTAWDQTVWWLSLAGLLSALTGAYLGVFRSLRSLKGRRGGISPFQGWMRWHHILGLAGGVMVLGWIFSGWLSMDHGRLFSRGQAEEAAAARFAGLTTAQAAQATPSGALTALGPFSRADIRALGGEPLVTAMGQGAPRVAAPERGLVAAEAAPVDLLQRAARAGWPGVQVAPFRPVPANDFYAAAEEMPGSAVVARVGGAAPFDLYVDAATGGIVTVMDRSRRAYAWAYFGLHSFKLPGLIERPWLWRLILLPPLMLGLAFSVTAVVLGWRRLTGR